MKRCADRRLQALQAVARCLVGAALMATLVVSSACAQKPPAEKPAAKAVDNRQVAAPERTAPSKHPALGPQPPAISQPSLTSREAARQAADALADPSYRIGAEDILEIAVWNEEALSKEVLVRPDGGFSFPLIGEVAAAGNSVAGVQSDIGQRLQKFVPDPVVSVAVKKVGSQRVYVIGRVNKPGEFPVGRPIDVLQALSMAGGLTPFASANDIKIVRRENGTTRTLPFQYSRIERGERLDQNIILQPGDVVLVP